MEWKSPQRPGGGHDRGGPKLTARKYLDGQSTGVALLSDLRQVFGAAGVERLPSVQLIDALLALPGRPWPEAHKGNKPITETWLARRLRPYGITPGIVRVNDQRLRGYELESVRESFERLLGTEHDGWELSACEGGQLTRRLRTEPEGFGS